MKKESWGEITVYHPSMAAKAAEMFNAFGEIWPFGFGGGVPYDELRVKNWLDNTSALADLIAQDREGNLVGYCGLYPHYRDSHAAYISILGVHPKVLGKKYGKKLLLQALEIAAEKGIQRVDLNTWSGNLKAMPLYKKVGLFWVPDTSVYMQDYVPGLLQIPLAREWFQRHPDWYETFERDVDQAPDKYVKDGMEVYTYTFESGGDILSADVDRYGWQFSSIERVLDSKKIGVKTRLRSHEIFIGIPNALTLELINETGEDLPVTISVEPFDGLNWREPFPDSVVVEDGETIKITREFYVDSAVTVFKSHEVASEVIKSVITLKDNPVELFTGGKIRPAVTVCSQELYKVAPPGKETTVYLDVINNTTKDVTGKITVFQDGASLQKIPFELSPHEVSGIEIPVSVPSDNPVTVLRAEPTLDMEDTSFVMPVYEYSVVADSKDVAVLVKGVDEKELVMLTDFVAVHIERERGRIRIHKPTRYTGGEIIDFDVGPPFGLSLDRSLIFDYEVIDRLTVCLTGKSIHVPGITIKKYIKTAPGMHEVEFWVVLTNETLDQPLHVAGKANVFRANGLDLDPSGTRRRVFTPIKGSIIESDPSTRTMSETMVPQTPEAWTETWTAAQLLNRSDFIGWIWNPEHVSKVTVVSGLLSGIESTTTVLNPGESYEPIRMWYTFSHGSLQEIRNRWNQLVGRRELPSTDQLMLQTVPPLGVELSGSHIIKKGVTVRTVNIYFATPYPFEGELQLNLPPKWKGHFVKGGTDKILMPEPDPDNPVPVDIELYVPETAEPSAVIQLHFKGEFELDFDIPLLVVGETEVRIEETAIEGHRVLEVSNGELEFSVVTEVGGNLIRLKDSQRRSFFADNYPEIKPKSLISYNIGGIQPLIFTPVEDNPFNEPERTCAEIVEDQSWKGVKVWWTVENQELLRGQNFAVTYMTVPGSRVIRITLEHDNPTARLVKWVALLTADLELQGSMDGTILTAPGGLQTWIKNRIAKPFVSLPNRENPWVRASKGDQSVTFFVPEGSPGSVVITDLNEVMLGLLLVDGETGPHGKTTAEFALVVDYPLEKVSELMRSVAKR